MELTSALYLARYGAILVGQTLLSRRHYNVIIITLQASLDKKSVAGDRFYQGWQFWRSRLKDMPISLRTTAFVMEGQRGAEGT